MKIGLVILVGLLLSACGGKQAGTAASPEEAKAYVKNLELIGVEMKASESFGGQQLVEITGQVFNKGNRPLEKVELHCVFLDPYNQPISRETVAIVRTDKGGLKAGETKAFRLPFDSIPKSWNQVMPQMVMAGVVFGQ